MEPRVTVTSSGVISFNRSLVEQLKLKVKQHITLAQDEESPKDWFVILNPDESNSPQLGGKAGDALSFSHIGIVRDLLSSLDLDPEETQSFKIASKDIGQPGIYAIFTSQPLKPAKKKFH